MPVISYEELGKVNAHRMGYRLHFNPPLATRAEKMLWKYSPRTLDRAPTDHMLFVAPSAGSTVIRAEFDEPFPADIRDVAARLGAQAYPGQEVEIVAL